MHLAFEDPGTVSLVQELEGVQKVHVVVSLHSSYSTMFSQVCLIQKRDKEKEHQKEISLYCITFEKPDMMHLTQYVT